MALRGASLAALASFVFSASLATAGPVGPVYPPPGGVTLGQSGDSGHDDGAVWTYEDFDFSAFDEMWWGPWGDDAPIKLAFDGVVDAPGEFLTFNADESDAAAGEAFFTGTADVPLLGGGTATLLTRLVLRTKTLDGSAPVAMVDPAAVGIDPSTGLVAAVNGPYRAEFRFEAWDGSNWRGALDVYDEMKTDQSAEGTVISSFSAGFFYTPVCGDGIIEGDEQCDDGSLNDTNLSCCDASCGFEPAGAFCDDTNLCTQTDECAGGANECVGSNPVVCEPLDQCHDAGTCDPGTGTCDDPASPDGTSCSDGDACTLDDTCQAGSCEAGGPTLLDPLANTDQTVECVVQTVPAP